MIDSLFVYVCQNADSAHYIFLALLFLAGLNLPISEDLLLLSAGAFVSRCIPEHYLFFYTCMFFGCWISGWETYWIGRYFGPSLYTWPWFNRLITKERVAKLHIYYEKYGIFTFILGRFIPGGVRNTLFMTSGMGKMPFLLFTSRDFIATLISTSTLFYLGFTFGENYELLAEYAIYYNKLVIVVIVILLAGIVVRTKLATYDNHPS